MRFVAVGNANVDIKIFMNKIPNPDESVDALAASVSSGGAASNFAVAAAKIGVESYVIASLGNDNLGRIYLETLGRCGVNTSNVKIVEGIRTGLVVILNVLGEDRRMIESPGANEELMPSDIIDRRELIISADEVHMASVRPEIAESVLEVRKDASWDPGMRIIRKYRDKVWSLISKAGKLFLNEKEAEAIAGESDPLTYITRIAGRGPNEVIVKMGSKGSLAWVEGEAYRVNAIPVKVVDTTGAGDIFAAVYLKARRRGYDVEDCLKLANAASAIKVSRPSTVDGMPNWDEIQTMSLMFYGK
ncbi:MAG: PfkB family carbohydrate kinase [Candidatus Korarchaeum sp.]|nr:PfkB family carbohydrate kinase [Candidatus Korarchaeum sp.]MDW8035495.1 PfkB family carbohydrate kinase [Candidatus Korarchaeum sp.]